MDLLHPRVLYETREATAYPLLIIYNKSISLGYLPADWKLAEVTAIYKKGSKSDARNYRPVSLTSVCCKVLESILRDHIMGYLLENDLISNKQYGFVKGRSTMLQLLHMMDKWTDYLENGGQIDTIYTDFEKAFDKVPHRRLIYKQRAYDISDSLFNWIQDFLTARQQRVRVNLSISAWGAVTSGIPQGSVLGPLLFLIYINDLIESCETNSEIYLFADDAKLFRHILDVSNNKFLQGELHNLKDWTDKWLLRLNVKKCKVVSFGRMVDNSYWLDLKSIQSINRVDR